MSKTAQRKRHAYEEGLRDGRNCNGSRYLRHPFMEAYRKGWLEGTSYLQPKTLLQRFREVFA